MTLKASADKGDVVAPGQAKREVEIPHSLTVKRLGELLGMSPVAIIKDFMKNGVMASINQVIDFDSAAIVASDLGFEAREEPRATPQPTTETPRYQRFSEDDTSVQKPRPPVVTIMGHVDHGKTSLLDAIRQSNVIATEAGGITQHIGAYQVEVNSQKITFLDTPGHEAFTAMRARGAQVTDIAILVVAADDGVMPQTVEAIDHAKAAGVPIVVDINKVDKPEANPERVKQQLAEHGLVCEEWGGDTICVPISAKRREGISALLENLLVVAELAELKANPNRQAVGTVIEAELDNTKGPLATILVQSGTLKIGDSVVVGDTWGKIKAMFNDKGKRIKRAEPATPVKVLGINAVALAGDSLTAVADEKEARALIEKRRQERASQGAAPSRAPTLDDLFARIKEGQVKELNLILKTDVQGSIEPLKNSVERLGTEEVKVKVIRSGSGNITESDVLLAIASKAIIIGFNTHPEPGARHLAEAEGVDIRSYNVIYNLVDDIQKAMAGMLEPVYKDVVEGHAEVIAIFTVRKQKVAGARVTEGKIARGSPARLIRNGQVIHESTISSLRHFKEDVHEMTVGFECGIGLESFSDFQVGDIIETYRKERVR